MDISKLGASQSSSLARSAQNPSKLNALADTDASPRSTPLPAEKLGNVLRPRLMRFQEKIDKRLAEIRKDNSSTPEQEAAFTQVQKKFHAMMSRFDRIVKDGNAEGVLDHVLGHLSDAISAAINIDKQPGAKTTDVRDVAAKGTNSGTSTGSSDLSQIDTLA